MKLILAIAFVFAAVACGHKDLHTTFNNYHFDRQVVMKLPLYDSLVNVIMPNYPAPHQFNNGKTSYRYVPASDGNELYKVFPQQKGDQIKHYLNQLGAELVYGFECYKDTTIKIMIRDIYIQKDHVNISERLSYFPAGKEIRKKDFPIKDSILNDHWQYWIAFDEVFF